MSLFSLTFLFLLLATHSAKPPFPCAECSPSCPHRCVCYENADLVDCRSGGFHRVPRGLPHGSWLLELGGNNLSVVGTHAFTGLRSLRVMVLTDSQVEEIQPQAFFSLSFLEKLDLSWNQLTILPVEFSTSLSALKELRLEHNFLHYISDYSFEHLDNLEKLDLSYNHLTVIGPGVFRGHSRLRQLYLHNNRLIVVQQGSLDMLPALEVLQLSHNNISHIDPEALAPLYSLALLALDGNNLHHLKFKTFNSLHTTATHIQLSGNPWSCDCDLHRVFTQWGISGLGRQPALHCRNCYSTGHYHDCSGHSGGGTSDGGEKQEEKQWKELGHRVSDTDSKLSILKSRQDKSH
ncbi:insulin-like growth factor-binding protein complex acid labile subunit [Gouania willdenowi]|uniref:insulin-like growth factor-binding protein complex acid labile subunit n=1 Tax=Gouania willdenowi TaxID=441366 RepID=UPI00105614FD|nr:insulin-like growth factor-binding protein complex acid labile subunit [Gouania willdenowi]